VDPKGTEQTRLLGLGYSVREASARNMGIRYPNFVETLVNTGQIASRLYSLYLSDLGRYGSIVFGGIDAQKYEGDLVTLNCLPRDDDVESFYLIMPNVTMVDENGITTQLINETNRQIGIFDSDSTAWEVEHTVYNKILNLTGCSDLTLLSRVGWAQCRLCISNLEIDAISVYVKGHLPFDRLWSLMRFFIIDQNIIYSAPPPSPDLLTLRYTKPISMSRLEDWQTSHRHHPLHNIERTLYFAVDSRIQSDIIFLISTSLPTLKARTFASLCDF
jgi:hypothetical protein